MGTLRDFTDETYEGIKAAIERNRAEIENGFSLPLRFQSLLVDHLVRSFVNIDAAEDGLAQYSDALSQKYWLSLAGLDKIFSDVYQVEADTLAGLEASKEDYVSLTKELEYLCSLVRPVNGRIPLQTFSFDELKADLNDHTYNNEPAYDRLLQKKVLALLDDPEFDEAAWEACTTDIERQELLNRLLARVQELMGTGVNPEIEFETTDHPDGRWGQFDPMNSTITLYPALMNFKDREDIMRVVFHETRHAYQREAVIDWAVADWLSAGGQGDYTRNYTNGKTLTISTEGGYEPKHPYVSEKTAIIWEANYSNQIPSSPSQPGATSADPKVQHQLYVEQPIEFDAWSFAGQLAPGVYSSGDDALYKLNPSYPGSWNVPKKP